MKNDKNTTFWYSIRSSRSHILKKDVRTIKNSKLQRTAGSKHFSQ